MSFTEMLSSEMKEAMKSKDALRLSVIRLFKSEITNEEKRQARLLEEAEVLEIFKKEMKKRNDAIDAFKKGGRNELAEKEEKELHILRSLSPTPLETLTEDQVREMVREIVASFPEGEKPQMGKIMPLVLPRTRDKIDGKTVNRIVRELLGSA
ncbi:MAG: GatB/YqeY domain-containing protein [Candidatus Eremiobacteraeota bacterium]|nr:GatB/YqeY domain-containing protein [Candidatus Eremiobacteraeota bacterium]